MILVADSGSTKTHWLLFDKEGQNEITFYSKGLNPYHTSAGEIEKVARNTVDSEIASKVENVFFYGSGCNGKHVNDELANVLSVVFPAAVVEVYSDIKGAARALFGISPGVAAILGTGSNTVIYDGKDVVGGINSLGWLLGDEGSGATIGKMLLQLYFRDEMDASLKVIFEEDFSLSYPAILEDLYKKPFVNRFLASFAPFAGKHQNHPLIKKHLEQIFDDFFKYQVFPLAKDIDYPMGIVGSVAFYFKDILKEKALEYGFEISEILRHPAHRLKQFHLDGL